MLWQNIGRSRMVEAEMRWLKGGGGRVTNNEYWSQTYSPKHSREFEFRVRLSTVFLVHRRVSQTDLASSPYAP